VNAVESVSVTKTYGNVPAIENVSLVIAPNRITGFIGPNGAGKTTLLKLIAGYLKPKAGDVLIFGEKPFNSLKVSANCIFVDDCMHFPPTLNLDDIYSMAGRVYANWDKRLAYALADHFGLDTKHSHSRLSRGQQSTFNAILGLAAHCPVTIFDEPMLGMDLGVRRDFYRAILKDYMLHPRNILFSSHMLHEAEELLEDVVLLKEGRNTLHMPLDKLQEYAIGLSGVKEVVNAAIKDARVIFSRSIGSDYTYAVIENTLDESDLHRAKLQGIETSAVAVAELCVYLTATRRGEIDDVFVQT